MKHLLSLVATLAATAALLLVLPGTAKADLNDATTAAPNPSGYATCTGTNPDGSTATWTVGGNITFISDTSNPTTDYPNGWHNIRPGHSNPYAGQGGNPCIVQLSGSGNIQAATVVQVTQKLTYTPNGGAPKSVTLDRRSTSGLAGGFTITYSTSTFTPLLNVNNVQYKLTSDQGTGASPGPTLGTAATPYL